MTHQTLPDAPPAEFNAERGIVWQASEGQIVNAGAYVLGVLLCWLIVPVLYAAYRFLATYTHSYQLTDQRLLETRGLLFKATEALELYRVKDLSIEQPLLQRLAGCGRVILLTSDRSTPRVVLNAIHNPHGVAELLRECVERCRVAKGVREID